MKTTKLLLSSTAIAATLAIGANVHGDNLAVAAAKASALVNRPVPASPHALEEFPGLLRGCLSSTEKAQRQNTGMYLGTYPDNLGAVAAQASALVNRPVMATPHGLEDFPWLLRGAQPAEPTEPAKSVTTYPDDLAAAAASASALVNRPIAASPHALEAFHEQLRGYSPQRPIEVAPLK